MDFVRKLVTGICFLLPLGLCVDTAKAEVFNYYANLGSTPGDQGWMLEQAAAQSGNTGSGLVKNGLYQLIAGAQSVSGDDQILYNWNVEASPFDFTTATPISFAARLSVDHSDLATFSEPTANWRAGYSLMMTDQSGHSFILGIGQSGIRLTNSVGWETSNSTGVYSVDTTAGLNTFEVAVQNSVAKVFLNGSATEVLSLGLGPDTTPSTRHNTFRWGDITTQASSVTNTEWVQVSTVPEPGSLALLGGMLGLGLVLWRRRS